MRSRLSGKVVWITGASSGIGRALAVEAARRGAAVILSGRNEARLEEAVRACAAAAGDGAAGGGGGTSRPTSAILPFDLEDAAARARACGTAPSLLGPIDVLVLNGGLSQRTTFLETSPESFDRIMDLDFGAQVDLIRRCLPAMVERGSGCVVGVSSIAGLAGAPLRPAYSSAKHALAGLLQNLRAELSATAVRIVTVYPGYVRTEVARNALDGSGRPTGEEDPHIASGASPESCARRIADAIEGGPVEIKVAFDLKSRFGLFLSRRIPTLWASLSAKHAGVVAPKGGR